ncbi:1-deoxy-D-xylulose-5-phosphate synthase [Anaerofilum sp. An201]|nr:1-deoxy-D-xylulose-5-phosphate synthase [Anaerofilum sp. An201]OUP01204.1 1-deoxy-D-xylulose-5-phosphate synthase [Anaerofilum sp. An201]
MAFPLLEWIGSPKDLKKLTTQQVNDLCGEIRSFLIQQVSCTGGHLSSNLGTIELTVALHRVFSTPKDRFVFDVGHQCYTHKLLTGRRKGFAALRQLDGISGFPNPEESPHDCFVAGHGNTALSAAIGMARAKKLQHKPGKVIAIIGDGAFTGGMVYEGMNNIDTLDNLIVILNDNKMSISKNVGSVANYLTRLRTSPQYFKVKADVEGALQNVPVFGKTIINGLQQSKKLVRRVIYKSTMFENMGFQYVGPLDGHDEPQLETLFRNLCNQSTPLFLHVVTVKGKGFRPAEQNPGAFHGVSAFDVHAITDPDVAPENSFSTVFGEKLAQLGRYDNRICAITAAMKYGTGLQFFYRAFPDRFFDVGMAEQHAVTFAAGLAREGMVPVVSIYSTFLQRSYDQIIHDVNLQKLSVVFAVDRAGLVPGDGETHQGVYDPAYFSQIEGLQVISPCNFAELEYWLEKLVEEGSGPRAIRYPRGSEAKRLSALGCSGTLFERVAHTDGASSAIVSYGSEVEDALLAAELSAQSGRLADVYKLTQIHPLPEGICDALLGYKYILFAEECIVNGGIGEHLESALHKAGWNGHFLRAAVPNTGIPHASVAQIKQVLHLDAPGLLQILNEDEGATS